MLSLLIGGDTFNVYDRAQIENFKKGAKIDTTRIIRKIRVKPCHNI